MASMFIGGKWVGAAGGETIPVLSPVDGQTFSAIARGRDVDVDTAVRAATRALSGAWGKMTATERGRVLSRLAQKISDNAEDLAQLEARDPASR
jgi:aldehyde dehydrogenase (NAD+)